MSVGEIDIDIIPDGSRYDGTPSYSSHEEDDNAHKIREAFAILTQGIEIIHYDTSDVKKGAQRVKRIVWMDSDILRICVDDKRPTLMRRSKGKNSPGLYMRDISEVKAGDNCYAFQKNKIRPENSEACFSLIGSERTICLELPGKMERDWFFERLELIVHDILTSEEREEKSKRKWKNEAETGIVMTEEELTAADHLQEVLTQGIQIFSHQKEVLRSVLSYEPSTQGLVLQPTDRSYLGYLLHPSMSLAVNDVVEIRPGTHSIGFVRTGCTDKYKECISIIGTECVFDLQLANEVSRNIFATKFRLFVKNIQSQK
mmetsp:Transcript_20397/g.19714  ORF Transcript_20397/g.19714 Transcript_20397/m.19714 type:complete len:315 (-) Transcript_20397:605-1549(-)